MHNSRMICDLCYLQENYLLPPVTSGSLQQSKNNGEITIILELKDYLLILGCILSPFSSFVSTSAASIALSRRLSNHKRHSFTLSSPSCFNRGSKTIHAICRLKRRFQKVNAKKCYSPISMESFSLAVTEMTPLENFCHCSLSGKTSFSHPISGSPSRHSSYF